MLYFSICHSKCKWENFSLGFRVGKFGDSGGLLNVVYGFYFFPIFNFN